jgi:hypothetical protein
MSSGYQDIRDNPVWNVLVRTLVGPDKEPQLNPFLHCLIHFADFDRFDEDADFEVRLAAFANQIREVRRRIQKLVRKERKLAR